MAGNDRALIYVSSSMSELAEERAVVREVVDKFGDGAFETFLFEEDAVAGDYTPQDLMFRQLGRTHAVVALVYQRLGPYTEEEIRLARELSIPVLLFRKKDETRTLEQDHPEFIHWLEDAEEGVTAKYFDTPKQLKKALKLVLQQQIREQFELARGARRASVETSTDGISLTEHEAAGVSRRSEPPRQLPKQSFFVGRAPEIAELLDAINAARERDGERLILLVGDPGVGKEAILRHVTHSGELPEFPDGTAIAPDWRDRDDPEDLLQALWEELYDSERPERLVDPRERDRRLRQVEALVFVPDLESDISLVLETMPRSVFCATASDAAGTRFAEVIAVEPLVDDDEIGAIFEHSYTAEFPDSAARRRFAEYCRREGATPAKIELLGVEAPLRGFDRRDAEGEDPLSAWVESLADKHLPQVSQPVSPLRVVGEATPRDVSRDLIAEGPSTPDAESGEPDPPLAPVASGTAERFQRAAREYLLDGSLSIVERDILSDLAGSLGLSTETAQALLADVARSAPGADMRRKKYRATIEQIVAAHGYPLDDAEVADLPKRRHSLLIGPDEASDIEQSVIEAHRATTEETRSTSRGGGSERSDQLTPPETHAEQSPRGRPPRSDRPEPHVFISYSRDDLQFVEALVAHLADAQVTGWIDTEGIDYGGRWETEIMKNLESCAALVVVMSEASKQSVWVEREIVYAERKQKKVLPLLLNGDVWFRLCEIQHESVLNGKMPTQRWVKSVAKLVEGHQAHPDDG